MPSKAFKSYIKFLMSGKKVKDYTIKFKIAINYDMTQRQIDTIDNLCDYSGIIERETFYETIKDYGFLSNSKVIEGEYNETEFTQDGGLSYNINLPEDFTFELDDTIQKILNIPIYVESIEYRKRILEKVNKLKDELRLIFSITPSSKIYTKEYNKSSYADFSKTIKEDYLTGKQNFLHLPVYENEQMEYSDNSYKYTFGVFVYLERYNEICPICYSQSYNSHTILDNFIIDWDSAGIISMESEE